MIVLTLLYLCCGLLFVGVIQGVSPLKRNGPRHNEPSILLQYTPGQRYLKWQLENGTVIHLDLHHKGSMDMPVQNYTFFYLYTPEETLHHQLIISDTNSLYSSTFNSNRSTKVLIHGFDNTYLSDMEQNIKDSYIEEQDVNVICVDWGALAGPPLYSNAVAYVESVGEQVAKLIDWLVTATQADISDFHLIGHSLGAHAAAFASKALKTGNVKRITGLDPAYPLFGDRPRTQRIDASDAEVVDCIHTCGGLLGFYTPICTHDFYPNGGDPSQLGCFVLDLISGGACSHGRSYELFASSIAPTNIFDSTSCDDFSLVAKNACSGDSALMGEPAENWPSGIYYLEPTKDYPYCKKLSLQ